MARCGLDDEDGRGMAGQWGLALIFFLLFILSLFFRVPKTSVLVGALMRPLAQIVLAQPVSTKPF
jgi:hypothetical protein